jgi:multiple sugar transport system ATP-binding protein
MTMGDRVAVLKDGVLQQVDTPRNLYERPNNVFVAGFIGSPAMNLLQLPIVDGGVRFGNTVLPVDRAILAKTKAAEITVGLRPEDLVISKSGLEVEVDVVEELGADAYLYTHGNIGSGDAELVARVDAVNHPKPGQKVLLAPEGGVTHLFDVESGARLN